MHVADNALASFAGGKTSDETNWRRFNPFVEIANNKVDDEKQKAAEAFVKSMACVNMLPPEKQDAAIEGIMKRYGGSRD